jgi:hypothetical protein
MTIRPVLGIDPGKGGALALLLPNLTVPAFYVVETIGKGTKSRVDYDALNRWWEGPAMDAIIEAGLTKPLACFETVSSMPSDSAKSAFSFGRALGAVEMFVETHGLPRTEMLPRDWQNVLLRGLPRSTYKQRKDSATLVARDLFPSLREPLRLARNQGVADAALIAHAAQLRERATTP